MSATKWTELAIRLPINVTILATQHGREARAWSTPCPHRLAITTGPGNATEGGDVLAICEAPECKTGFLRIQVRTYRGFLQYRAVKPVRFVRGQ